VSPRQGVLALVRSTDPESSRDGARRAHVGSQRATILGLLLTWGDAFGHETVSINADLLVERFTHTQRSVWSSRLSGMASAGLLDKDVTTNPVSFTLTPEGRRMAKAIR
jgi:hypothetical protein